MYPNPLKQKLHSDELVLGTVLPAPTPYVSGVVCKANPDFIWIDTEHGPFGTESLDPIPTLMRNRGVAPMIRVAGNDPVLIKKAYDIGAVAVMVPQVDTPEEAAQVVRSAKYAPQGERGLTPLWTVSAGEDFDHVIRTANDETVVVIQLESQRAFDNIDELKQVEGIDVVFVGPLDLSASVGTITETGSAQVQEIMREVPQRLKGTGIVAGTTLVDLEDLKEKVSWGYRYVNVGNALAYGVQTVQEHMKSLRSS